MEVTTDESSLANDILRGAKAIADFIGETEKRTRYLAERAVIPVGKEGGILIASKRRLRERYERLTGGQAEAAQQYPPHPHISRRRPANMRPGRGQGRPETVEPAV